MADGSLVFDTLINSSGFKLGMQALGGIAKKSVAGIAAATAAASTAVAALAKQSAECYADYEQLAGGSKLMFGSAYDYIADKAKNAFKDIQMSQNDYLQQVNGFAVGLKTALGGDELAAAKLADRIVTAEADIVAATGNTAENVQNAFNGIMKNNFTMLDNLQIGITPTKEGFQELIDKVNAWKESQGEATNYVIDNLADCQNALVDYIEMQKLSGYAQAEGAATLSGSMASMKAAWENLLTGISDPTQDLDRLVSDLTDSISNVMENFKPVINSMLPQMAKGVTQLAEEILPMIPETINNMLPSVLEGADSLIGALINTLSELFAAAIPIINDNVGTIIDTLISGLTTSAPELAKPAAQLLSTLTQALSDNTGKVTQGAIDVITALCDSLSDEAPTLIPAAVKAIGTIAETLVNNLDKILSAGGKIIKSLAEAIVSDDTLSVFATEIPKVIDTIVLYIGENLNDFIIAGYNIAESIVEGIFSYDWSGVAEDIGAKIHQGEVEAERLAMEDRHSDDIAKWGKMTLSELNTELIRIKDEMGKVNIYENLYDYLLEGKGELEDALSDGLISQDIFDEVKNCGEDTFMYLQNRIEDTDAAYTDLEEQSKLITDIIAKENAKLSEGTKRNKEWQKSIADGYAENARNAANTKAWVPDYSAAENANGDLVQSNNALADNTEETASKITKSSKKISDEFRSFYEDLKYRRARGFIDDDEYKQELTDKLNSSSEYASALYTSYWSEIQTNTDKATETITEAAKDQWESIDRLNKMGIYNDKKTQEERLKWIKRYCPQYADEYYEYYSEVYDYQRSMEEQSLKSTKETLSEQADIVKAKLSEISSEYKSAYKDIQSDISKYKSALMSVGDTFSVTESEDENGNKTKKYTVNDVSKRLEKMKKYHESLLKLRDMGASNSLISEIIGLGAEDGAYMAEQLVRDKDFANFNDLYKQLDDEAQAMANEFYAPDIQKLNDNTAEQILSAYGELPAEFGALGSAAAEAFSKGMSGDITEVITNSIGNFGDGIKSALEGMKSDYNFLDFLESTDYQKIGLSAGQDFYKGFSAGLGDIEAARSAINAGGSSLVSASAVSSGVTSASSDSGGDTVLNAKIYTTVTLDGDKVGQAVTDYQFRRSQEGGT